MATFGIIDPEFKGRGLIDPEFGGTSLIDPEFASTPSGGGGTTFSPTGGSLTLSGVTALLTLGFIAAGGSLSLAGATPSLVIGTVRATSATTLVLTTATPSLVQSTVRVPTAGALALTGATSSLALTVAPTGTVLALTGATPSLNVGASFQPTGASLTFSGSTPVQSLGLNPAAATLTLSASTPAVNVGASFQPTGATLTLSSATPVQGLGINPAGGALVLTTTTPSLVVSTVRVPTGTSLSLTGATPSFVQSAVLAPTGTGLALSGSTPLLKLGLNPAAATLILTTATPTVNVGASMQPPGGVLILSGATPILAFKLNPVGSTLSLVGATPIKSVTTPRSPTGTTLSLTGAIPTLFVSAGLQTQGGTLLLVAATPSLVFGPQIRPVIVATVTVTEVHRTVDTPLTVVLPSWELRGSLPEVAMLHSLALLNGVVYKIGGTTNIVSRSTDDGATWVHVANNLPYPNLDQHVSTVYQNRVYVMGGNVTGLPETGVHWTTDGQTWTAAPSMPVGLVNAACAVFQGKIVVMGGFADDGHLGLIGSRSVYVFDGASWSTAIGLLPYDVEYAATAVLGDRLALFGGNSQDLTGAMLQTVIVSTDLTVDWVELGVSVLPYRVYPNGAPVINGAVYLPGGFSGDVVGGVSSDVYRSTNLLTWTQLPSLPQGVENGATVALGQSILLAGGDDGVVQIDTVYALVPEYTMNAERSLAVVQPVRTVTFEG